MGRTASLAKKLKSILNNLYDEMKLHFLTILIAGSSATFWAVYTTGFVMPFIWLLFLVVWIVVLSPAEFKMFLRRFSQIGLLLLVISLVQIIFRRQGDVLVAIHGFPLVFSEGFTEAILLWIRFMIIFMLAFIFGQVPLFDFFLFLNKIRTPFQLSLLLLTTIKFIPFIFDEAKKGLWAIRFRGIQIGALGLKNKFILLRKLLIPMLYRGMHYVSFSSLALELRGYGAAGRIKMNRSYPLHIGDIVALFLILAVNSWGLLMNLAD